MLYTIRTSSASDYSPRREVTRPNSYLVGMHERAMRASGTVTILNGVPNLLIFDRMSTRLANLAPSLGRWHQSHGGKGADLSVLGGSEGRRHEHVGIIHHISDPEGLEAAEDRALDSRGEASSILQDNRAPQHGRK